MRERGNDMELVLLDEDLDYAQSIRDFLQIWDGGTGIALKQFTKLVVALDHVRRNPGGNVLLALESYATFITQEAIAVIILTEQLETEEGRFSKFQPLEQLMGEARKALQSLSERQAKRTRIVGWFSAAGGCGKSTAAFNLAMQLAQHGEDVCLVSLESTPSAIWNTEGAEASLSEWLYFAKTKPKLAADRAASLLLPGPQRGLYVTAPFEHMADALDMTESDVELMLDSLSKQNRFSWIVIDGETGWGPRQQGAAVRCDLAFWIVTDDLASVNKTAKLLSGWRSTAADDSFTNSLIWTSGKYVGVSPSGCERLGVESEAVLPYVPRWKSVKRAEELLGAEFYSQQLWHVFHTAESRRRKGGERIWTGSYLPS